MTPFEILKAAAVEVPQTPVTRGALAVPAAQAFIDTMHDQGAEGTIFSFDFDDILHEVALTVYIALQFARKTNMETTGGDIDEATRKAAQRVLTGKMGRAIELGLFGPVQAETFGREDE